MTGLQSNASCSPKTLGIGAYLLARNIFQFLARGAPWAVAFLLGFGIQIFLVNTIVEALGSEDTQRQGLDAMLQFSLNACCLFSLVFVTVGNKITIDKPVGLLPLMVISWIAMAIGFLIMFFAIAMMMLAAFAIAGPAIGFGWIMEWLVNHQIISIVGFDKGLTVLLFYPLALGGWAAYYLLVSVAQECCRLGQAHTVSK